MRNSVFIVFSVAKDNDKGAAPLSAPLPNNNIDNNTNEITDKGTNKNTAKNQNLKISSLTLILSNNSVKTTYYYNLVYL